MHSSALAIEMTVVKPRPTKLSALIFTQSVPDALEPILDFLNGYDRNNLWRTSKGGRAVVDGYYHTPELTRNLLVLMIPIECYYLPHYRVASPVIAVINEMFNHCLRNDAVGFIQALSVLPQDGSGAEYKCLLNMHMHKTLKTAVSPIDHMNALIAIPARDLNDEKDVKHVDNSIQEVIRARVNQYLIRLTAAELQLARLITAEEKKQIKYVYVNQFLHKALADLLKLKRQVIDSAVLTFSQQTKSISTLDLAINQMLARSAQLIAGMGPATPDESAMKAALTRRQQALEVLNQQHAQAFHDAHVPVHADAGVAAAAFRAM